MTPHTRRVWCPCREREKKESDEPSDSRAGQGRGGSGHSLETFYQRLRDLCASYGGCHGPDRRSRIEDQAEQARALADRLGILIHPDCSWSDYLADNPDLWIGSEHVVEFAPDTWRYGKITIPPAFGLVPEVISLPFVNLRAKPGESTTREVIEFLHATPLEYLARWIANNDVFGDDVKLASVIAWPDGKVSFGITQPQYHG